MKRATSQPCLAVRNGPVDKFCFVIAKYDYTAQEDDELDLRENEKYILINDTKHWWWIQNTRGQSGYVPSNYVKRVKPSLFNSLKKKVKRTLSLTSLTRSKTLPNSRSVEPPSNRYKAYSAPANFQRAPQDSRGEAIRTAIVKHAYQPQQTDELELIEGSRILIIEKGKAGWWKGQCGKCVGWFPANYVQEENEDEPIHTRPEDQAGNVLDIMVALCSFNAQNDEELSFTKGDGLAIVDRSASNPIWFKARKCNGQVGLVPRNCLQRLSEFLAQPLFETNGLPATLNRSYLTTKNWYFGSVSRAECDQLLNMGLDGDFLIRDSETNPGDFSVSLKAPGRTIHLRVHVENGNFLFGQRKFASLDQLVEHYHGAPIYINQRGDSGVEFLYLVRALPRPVTY